MNETDAMQDTNCLKQAHAIMSEMLGSVDTILKKAKVRYILGFGTLLGAVRHKGFIPWDDDIDLFVFEEDFPAAVRILEEELTGHSNYALQSNETDPMFWHAYVNVRHLHQKLRGCQRKFCPFNTGGCWSVCSRRPQLRRGI
jgi:lipopolysaccharide cholinephosphotransferase